MPRTHTRTPILAVARARPHLQHLPDDGLHGGSEHLLLRSERPEHVVILVRSVQLLVRHAHAVVARLRGDDVKVPRRFFPAKNKKQHRNQSDRGQNGGCIVR